MSTYGDQNGRSLTQFDMEQQKDEARGTLYLERRDSSGSSTEGSDFYGASTSTSTDGNTAELLHGFQRKLSFVWSSFVSQTSAADTSPTNESSPLMNPLKPRPERRTSRRTWLNQTWRLYEKNLDKRPLVTKAITSGCLTLVGDFVGQCIEQQRLEHNPSENGNFDLVRLVKFSSLGLFLQAPLTHYFYVVLDYYLPPTPYPWTPTTFLKLTFDQLIYAPFLTFMVILYLGICGGSSWHGVQEQLEVQYWRMLVDNWKLWVPATVINMAYVAPAYRVLYCNIVFFVWSIYLSLTLNTAG